VCQGRRSFVRPYSKEIPLWFILTALSGWCLLRFIHVCHRDRPRRDARARHDESGFHRAAGNSRVIVLPGAKSARGASPPAGAQYFTLGDRFRRYLRGDLRTGASNGLFIRPQAAWRSAQGRRFAPRPVVRGRRVSPARPTSNDLETGADWHFQLGAFINDVVVTEDAAWFTDSALPHLYRYSRASWDPSAR